MLSSIVGVSRSAYNVYLMRSMFSIQCLKRHPSLMFIPSGLKEVVHQAGIVTKYKNASDSLEVSSLGYKTYLLQTMLCIHCLNRRSPLLFTFSSLKELLHQAGITIDTRTLLIMLNPTFSAPLAHLPTYAGSQRRDTQRLSMTFPITSTHSMGLK